MTTEWSDTESDYSQLSEAEQLAGLSTPSDRKRRAVLQIVDRVSYLEGVAKDAIDNAKTYIADVQSFTESLSVPTTVSVPTSSITIDAVDYSSRPALDMIDLSYVEPVLGKALSLESLAAIEDEIDLVSFPSLLVTTPLPTAVPAPTISTLGMKPTAPTVSYPTVQPMPSVSIATPPTIVIPNPVAFPNISVPDFDEKYIPISISSPGSFSWGAPVYASDIWSDLLARVLSDIKNGGTGLLSSVEDAIFKNHLKRIFEENDKRYIEAENYFAGRGFSMPSGMLQSALSTIGREAQASKDAASRDIMIAQADLAQKQSQFIIEKGVQIEGMLRQFFIDSANMALSAEKEIAAHSVEIHKASVEKARMAIEQWKAKHDVWKANLEKALIPLDIIKSQIEARTGDIEAQRLIAAVYSEQIAAAKMTVDLYNSSVQGSIIGAEVEKAKIALYEQNMKAWMIGADVNKQKIELYNEQLSSNKQILESRALEIEAHEKAVQLKQKELDKALAKQAAVIEKNKLLVQEFAAYIDKYKAEYDAEVKIVGAKVDGFKASSAAYEAETGRDAVYYAAKEKEAGLKIQNGMLKLQEAVAKIDAAVKGYEAIKKLELAGTEGVMQVGAQLAASAIQGINTNSSISYSAGDSYSQSEDFSYSKSEIKQVTATI